MSFQWNGTGTSQKLFAPKMAYSLTARIQTYYLKSSHQAVRNLTVSTPDIKNAPDITWHE
ncbi:MAG TPA: hypothetical protein VE177_06910 [Candidatus Binatus sp.]|nr:hypothetical protein [Candidatus Binatus sp.]